MNLEFLQQLNFKRIMLVLFFVAVCIGLGFGIYALFFKAEEPRPGEPGFVPPSGYLPETQEGFEAGEETPGGSLPQGQEGEQGKVAELQQDGSYKTADGRNIDNVAQGGRTIALPLTENKVKAVTSSADGKSVVFYNTDDNKFYTLSSDGSESYLLSNQEFYGVESVSWSDDRTKAIISYPDGSKIYYNFNTDSQTSLQKEINEPDFSKNDEVAYKYITNDEQGNWLAISDPQGGQSKLVQSIGDNHIYVDVDWSPTEEVVATFQKPIGYDESEIYFLGQNEENNKTLRVAGTNFHGIWSPSGTRMLYDVTSSQNGYRPTVWISEVAQSVIGRNKKSLGLNTWVDKCVFSNERTVYCAVPQELPEGAGLRRDLVVETDDLIYRIELSVGRPELLADPISPESENFNVGNIQVSKDASRLYYWDANSGKVFVLRLK